MIKRHMMFIWNRMSLKKKLYSIIITVGILMLFGIMANVQIIYAFMDDIKLLMDDNLSSYRFQEALGYESEAFSQFIRKRTDESEKALTKAAEDTKSLLKELPYDYEQIGEARYAITWNIQNSYEVYRQQREKLIAMKAGEQDYIRELYKTYQMQEYLKDYAVRLMREVLDGGNIYYERRVSLLKHMPYIICAGALTALVFLFILSRMLTRDMVAVLLNLVLVSRGIERNDYSVQDVFWEGEDEIGQLVHAFNKMKHATRAYVHTLEEKQVIEERLHRQELEQANLEQRFAEAQLQLIKSQLNPHFLFNTLNMITRMTQLEEAPVSQEMLVALSNLLRYSLRTTAAFTPLNQELKVVEDYMYIQKKRFGERISWQVERQVEESTEVLVFLLQPLVENAVIHGISMKEEGGHINIRILQKQERLYISVRDEGLGMSKERLRQIKSGIKQRGSGLGIGLGNIYRRITAYYEQGEIVVESREGHGTCVNIILGKRKYAEKTVFGGI